MSTSLQYGLYASICLFAIAHDVPIQNLVGQALRPARQWFCKKVYIHSLHLSSQTLYISLQTFLRLRTRYHPSTLSNRHTKRVFAENNNSIHCPQLSSRRRNVSGGFWFCFHRNTNYITYRVLHIEILHVPLSGFYSRFL